MAYFFSRVPFALSNQTDMPPSLVSARQRYMLSLHMVGSLIAPSANPVQGGALLCRNMSVPHVVQKYTSARVENAAFVQYGSSGIGSGHVHAVKPSVPVPWRQESQLQIPASRGKHDFGKCQDRLFALHRHCAMTSTVSRSAITSRVRSEGQRTKFSLCSFPSHYISVACWMSRLGAN